MAARNDGEVARARPRRSSAGKTKTPTVADATAASVPPKAGVRKATATNSGTRSAKPKPVAPKRVTVKQLGSPASKPASEAAPRAAKKSTAKAEKNSVSWIASRILAGKLMPTLEQVRALAVSALGLDERNGQNRAKGKAKNKRKGKGKKS
jgi:hypothetical protein